jgi:hypothetical protein
MFERSKNLSGMKFGNLTALAPAGKDGKSATWRCLCDCGNQKIIRGSNLTARVRPVTSCGCARGFENLIGRRFGKWSVLERRGNDCTRNARWLCRCDCGTESMVSSDALRGGQSESCGCAKLTRGGDSASPEYNAWRGMICRCYNSEDPGFKHYGERGISVCDEWRASYEMFLGHVGRRPGSEYSIGRIDNDGNYEPGNVRWETREQQQNNTRANVWIEYDGKRLTCAQWERHVGLPAGMIASRLARGWTGMRAITTPDSNGKWTKPVKRE